MSDVGESDWLRPLRAATNSVAAVVVAAVAGWSTFACRDPAVPVFVNFFEFNFKIVKLFLRYVNLLGNASTISRMRKKRVHKS